MESFDGLDDTTDAQVGTLLVVKPYYGWGWHDGAGRPADVPQAFHARLVRLWTHAGVRRGGIAVIEENGHPLSGCILAFATSSRGTYNFTTRMGWYQADITDSEPSADGSQWPLRDRGPDVRLDGWVMIRAAVAANM